MTENEITMRFSDTTQVLYQMAIQILRGNIKDFFSACFNLKYQRRIIIKRHFRLSGLSFGKCADFPNYRPAFSVLYSILSTLMQGQAEACTEALEGLRGLQPLKTRQVNPTRSGPQS